MKKYELCPDRKITVFGKTLFQIRALISFCDVVKGEYGGYIENENNLDQSGNAWVYDDAWVSGNARVFGNAWVFDDAWVSGNARVCGNAQVYDDARVYGNAQVSGDAWVSGNARVFGNARVCGDAWVYGNAHYIQIGPIGSRNDAITFFRTKELHIAVKIGCFDGTIEEFEAKVKSTHRENDHAKAYMLAAQIARTRIDLTPEKIKEEKDNE